MSWLKVVFINTILLCTAGFEAHAHAAQHSPSCKAVPGTPDWPSAEAWARLNESIGGRLLQPPPPGAVCHPGQPTYNATECPAIQSAWTTYTFHQADPISVGNNEFSNDSCLPESSYPCSGEGYPLFVINATSTEHVRLGVNFARQHNVRLIVKATGHDYLGRSVAPNALSIWTRHLQGIKTHDSFQPGGCNVKIDSTAVTAGAGTQMLDLYSFLAPLNQTVVGGGGATVGVGGYLTGGGHSLLSARYGLAADQVLQMEVVTPQGKVITANECQNADIFWALRGGGGSTFGVVTSVTIKTFPSPSLINLVLSINTLNIGSPSIPEMVAYVLSQYPFLGDQGLSGYSFYLPATPNPLDGGNTTAGGISMIMVLQDTQSPEDMLKLWTPILTHINATWPEMFAFSNITTYPSFYSWYQEHYDTTQTGTDLYDGSRLLDAAALTANLTLSTEVFKQCLSGGGGTALLVSGKGVHNAQPRGGGDAVCPAWRKAYVHSTLWVEWAPLNATAKSEAQGNLEYSLAALRKLAPDSGAYINEAYPFEPDWQHQFWGVNYERLVKIKRAVDPDDVLWCNPCVGNERWHEVGDQLCRVTDLGS